MGRKKKEFIKCCGNCLLCTHTNQGGECAITDIVDETWEACENYIPDGSENYIPDGSEDEDY